MTTLNHGFHKIDLGRYPVLSKKCEDGPFASLAAESLVTFGLTQVWCKH